MECQQSYEAKKLNAAIEHCQSRIADDKVSTLEKQAMAFYLNEIKQITPCADENKFRKFAKGIGGSGDTEVIKPYVVRNRQTNKPLQKSDGSFIKYNIGRRLCENAGGGFFSGFHRFAYDHHGDRQNQNAACKSRKRSVWR